MLTLARSPKSHPLTFMDTPNVTFSPGLADGRLRFNLPEFLQLDLFGAAPVPASLSQLPVKAKASKTSATSGPSSSTSSEPAILPLSSENKSPARQLLEKQCKSCGQKKQIAHFRIHNKGGFRGTCRDCENRSTREKKPWNSEAKKNYQARRRITHRGFVLTREAQRRAEQKGIPFNLDWREIQTRIDAGFCEVTGLPFNLNTPKSWDAPSIDQMRAGEGYSKDNTRVVLYALNTMANEWGEDLIITIAQAIQAHRQKQSLIASNALSERIGERLKINLSKYGSMEYNLTWKEHTTPSGRRLWRHVASARRTSVKDVGGEQSGWPTLNARDWKDGAAPSVMSSGRSDKLAHSIFLLTGRPTPRAEDSESSGMRHSRGVADTLTAQASVAGWATPITNDALGSQYCYGPKKPDGTRAVFLKLPGEAQLTHGEIPTGTPAEMANTEGFQLNPAFSLWLMGYPTKWHDAGLSALRSFVEQAMPSARKLGRNSSKRSSKASEASE